MSPTRVGHMTGYAWREFVELARIETDECVLWPYSKISGGYGRVRDPSTGTVRRVTHLALERRGHSRPFPKAEAAHGPCHNPACFNYRHLSWATRQENEAHKHRDGTTNRGERHGMAKLKESDVGRIRKMRADGVLISQIAREMGVHRNTIYRIVGPRNRPGNWEWVAR